MTVLAGRYRLENLLGRGGMGKVWRATDLTLDRVVAVKLVPADFEDDVVLARFQREARIAARLSDHPHIVSVHDYGRRREGRTDDAYIVMELVDGRPLSALTAGGPLEPVKALLFAEHIARALEAAHADGIVHRDVKPANAVLVEKPGRPEAVKVLDFGISSLGEHSSRLTPAGAVMGTPAYIAPEVWNGQRATAASDLYALGAVLFELLTGRPPFVRDNHYAYYVAHLQAPPEPLDSYAPALPSEVGRLIQALLAKDPGERPPTAAEVADALRDLRGDHRIPPAARNTAPRPTAHSGDLPAATLVRDTPIAPGPADSVRTRLNRIAEADNTGNASLMHHHGHLLRKMGDIEGARTWLTRAAEAGNTNAMDGLGRLCQEEDDTAGAITWWTRAAEAGDTNAMYNLGQSLSSYGDTDTARLWWTRASEAGNTYAMNRLGSLHRAQNNTVAARTWWTRAAHAGDADAAYNLGHLLDVTGDAEAARAWWTRAADDGINAYAMFVLGAHLRDQGDPTGAHTWLTRAAEAGNAHAMSDLGDLLYEKGDIDTAHTWWTRATQSGHPAGKHG